MKKFFVLSTLALSFAVSPVLAEGGGGPGHKGKMMEKMFEHDDLDGDGTVSKEEFLKAKEQRFDEIDANDDSKLTKEELKTHMETMRSKHKEMKDKRKGAAGEPGDAPAPAEAPADVPADAGGSE